jgi:N-carbamoyl-L-amino-acid hydrolase
VLSFADEEGARFNTPTFGSRALVGSLDVEDALARVDRDGVTLRDAMATAGVDPTGLADAPAWLERLLGFLELHIDQTRDVDDAGVPGAVVARMAARVRLEVELRGRADHAGTTRGADRRDALAAAARLIVRADDLAAEDPDIVFTAARIDVEPNASTTVPSRVRLWLNARAPDPAVVERWRTTLAADAEAIAAGAGTRLALTTAAWSAGTEFPVAVRDALAEGLATMADSAAAPVVSYAGHDAGVIAAARPAGMIFVRNPTGISHAPDEDVSLADAARAANAVLKALETLA